MNNYGVFFDLDGTLVDSLPDICGNLNLVREAHGLARTPNEVLRASIGKGVENLIRVAIPEFGPERHADLVRQYRAQYAITPQLGGAPYPGVEATLRKLRAMPGLKIGIATNKTTSLAELMLALYFPGLTFDVIAGPERVSKKKPEPEHLLETLAKAEVDPSRAWFVGDDPVDQACARAAGVRFFAATWGIGRIDAPATEQLATFPQLLEKIVVPPPLPV